MPDRSLIVAALLAMCFFVCGTGRADVIELHVLEQHALERHSLLQAGAARERAAAAEIRQAESAFHPRVGVTADGSATPGSKLISIPGTDYLVQGARTIDKHGAFQPQVRAGANVTVSAPIYDFGRTSAAVAASRAQRSVVQSSQDLTRAEVIAGVRNSYLAWLSASELFRLAGAAHEDATARFERVQALVEEGARPRGDLIPVQADKVLSELELKRASGRLRAARVSLEQASAVPIPDTSEPDRRVLDMQPEVKLRTNLSATLLSQQRAGLEATARLHRRERLPVLATSLGLGIGARFQDDNSSLKVYTFPTFIVGLSLTVPLWDGGAAKAAAEAAEARMEELGIRLEDADRGARQEHERALVDVENARELEETAGRLIALFQVRLNDTASAYELGAMQFEHVQQARASLRQAETELILARVARAEAVLRIKPIEGGSATSD